MRRFFRRYGLLLLIILLGFALRIYLLNDVVLSPDERNVTNEFLRIPLSDLLQATTQHGFPEHIFAGIFIWFAYNHLGWQLFLLRWPGILFSVLTLPAIYSLTRRLIGNSYALAATFLLCFSRYHIYSSHQIRGYAHMVFFAVASFYFLWLGMERQRWRDWLCFALVSGIGLYNQLFSFTLLATQGMIVIIWLSVRAWRQRPLTMLFLRRQILPPLLAGGLSIILAGLLFAPLLPQFFQHSVAADSDFPLSTLSLTDTLLPYLFLFDAFSGAWGLWSGGLFLTLILLGIVFLLRFKPEAAGVLVGWLIIPLLLVVFGQLAISWFYVRDRYLIYILPAFLILAAAGWMGLFETLKNINPIGGRSFFGVSLVLITLVSTMSVTNYLYTASIGNWQAVADFLMKNELPTDLVMCEPYGHGWKDVDLNATDDCTRSLTYRLTEQSERIYPLYNLYTVANWDNLAQNPVLMQRNPRVWVVVWDLPGGVDYQNLSPAATFQRLGRTLILGPIATDNVIASLDRALEEVNILGGPAETNFALLTRRADLQAALGQTETAEQTLARAKAIMPNDPRAEKQLAAIEQHLEGPPLVVTPVHTLPVDFGSQIHFGGYSISPEPPIPGQPARLTLFWQALASPDIDYSIFLHLRNDMNQTVAQLDVSPQPPTSDWWSGDVLHDTVNLQLPAGLLPGRYRLLVGLYNLKTLERLPVINDRSGENAVELMQWVIPN